MDGGVNNQGTAAEIVFQVVDLRVGSLANEMSCQRRTPRCEYNGIMDRKTNGQGQRRMVGSVGSTFR